MAVKEAPAKAADKVIPEPTVRIYLPLLEESDSGMKADQTETVIINGKVTIIQRGVHVEVSPEVYTQLRNKYDYL